MTVTLCLSCSLRCSTRSLGVHCWMLAFFMASYQHLLWTPNSIGGFRGPLRSGVAFPTTSGLYCLEFCWQLLWHPIQLNNIIIQCPHDRPLDLWNRMFNRHQAEITVMQFRGYSLPVHHCSDTIRPSPCPISQALIRPRDLFRLLAIGMRHFLPVYHLGTAFLGRVEGQNMTSGAGEYTNSIFAEGKTPSQNECPVYDIKQSDGEASVMLELWEMQSISSLSLLPGTLWLQSGSTWQASIYGSNRTVWHSYWVQTNDLC